MIDYFKTLLGTSKGDNEQAAYQNVRPPKAQEMMQAMAPGTYEIIDVRTPEEFEAGHIEGAKLINLFDPGFGKKIAKLDADKTYFLICRSGNRSSSACSAMSKQGFGKLYNISGGMSAWK